MKEERIGVGEYRSVGVSTYYFSDTPKLRFFLFTLLTLSLLTAFVPKANSANQGRAGSTTAAFLELGVGGRPLALGEAYVGVSGRSDAMGFNPAGIANILRPVAYFSHEELIQDLNFNHIQYAQPFGAKGAIGFSAFVLDLGDFTRTTLASGAAGQTLGVADAGFDLALSATYANEITRKFRMGGTFKVIRSKLDTEEAAGVAVDLGVQYELPIPGLTLGVSVNSMGTNLKFVNDHESLPTSLRYGLAYEFGGHRQALASLELKKIRGQTTEVHFGGEYTFFDMVTGRIGFLSGNDAGNGLTAGAGFKYGPIRVDYAFSDVGDLGNRHQTSVAVEFGPKRAVLETEKRSVGVSEKSAQRRHYEMENGYDGSERRKRRAGEVGCGGAGEKRRGGVSEYNQIDRESSIRKIPVTVGAFRNPLADPGLKWLEKGLIAVTERALRESNGFELRKFAPYKIEGGFLKTSRGGVMVRFKLKSMDGRVISAVTKKGESYEIFRMVQEAVKEMESVSGDR